MSKKLENQQVIVTGAGSGIGRAVVTKLTSEGAIVVGADIDLKAAEESCLDSRASPRSLDVVDPESWQALVGYIDNLDGLVNCAGVDAPHDNVEECTPEDWERVMRVNLDGVFIGTKLAVEAMRTSGQGGSIVNISSVLAMTGSGETVSYGPSKAAVGGLTRSVALAMAGEGIRCNSVHPGYIRTPMTDRWTSGDQAPEEEVIASLHPLGRLGEPEEVANLVAYLISEESAYVSGAQLVVDGGYLAV